MRLTRTVLPALLAAVFLSGCGGGNSAPAPTESKGGSTPTKPGVTPADPKAADAAKKFATDFLAAVRDKKANPEQLTPEFKKVFSDSPAADLTFLATEVSADEVNVTVGPDGSAFAVGKSKSGGGRTLLRLVKSGADFKVDWISVGVKGVADATLGGDEAPAQFVTQALLDAVVRKKYAHASALLTDNARNTLGKSDFGGFDQGALKTKLDALFGGADKYAVTGASKGTVTVELSLAGGKKTAVVKTAKGTRPGDWLVDAVEVK